MKVIIVGGVAGGATAAARMRRNDENVEIILVERGDYISYANCGLPYYLGGVITERNNLLVQTKEGFSKRFNVDVRVKEEVIKIDTAHKVVQIRKSDSSTYEESFDKLLLSPGAAPFKPNIKGIENEGIFTLRNVKDVDTIKAYAQKHSIANAVVIGGGFIGLEMAENLRHQGVNVSLVEMSDQVMAPLDFSMANIVHAELVRNKVNLFLQEEVTSFAKSPNGIDVSLKSGSVIHTQMVILSLGVRPETSLAADAGLTIGEARGIKVDEYLKTSHPDIYAVGDAIEYPHPITKKPWLNLLAGPANRQARIVADNIIYGDKLKYEGSIGTAIAKVFNLEVGSTGLSSKKLTSLGIPHAVSYTHSSAHASYYPGGGILDIKITFDKASGKLYGAQVVGPDGVDKRLDEFALVIKKGGNVYDLTEIEHAYAPPFSSAKDPVAMAGYVATNIVEERFIPLTWRELKAAPKDSYILIDVRTKAEYESGRIMDSINIPLDEIRDRLDEFPRDKAIFIYCGVGLRGYLAARILKGHGFADVKNLCGGIRTYNTANRSFAPCLDNSCFENCGPSKFNVNASTCSSTCNSSARQDSSSNQEQKDHMNIVKTVDVRGIQCPGPILKLKSTIDEIAIGERIKLIAKDESFTRDAQAWCNTTHNTYEGDTYTDGVYEVIVRKGIDHQSGEGSLTSNRSNSQGSGSSQRSCSVSASASALATSVSDAGCTNTGDTYTRNCDTEGLDSAHVASQAKSKTFIMFSDDLDKVMATFVLANGAAATGQKVSIFFTFWGLNAIKKLNKPMVNKDVFGRMFSMMLPSNSLGLKLSKMNMGGLGSKLMRFIMNKKGISSLETLRQQAIDAGVEFIACEMSMDVMGVTREELMDNVTFGGVATYMERADHANVNLFI